MPQIFEILDPGPNDVQELYEVISTHETAGIQQAEGSEACLPSDPST